MITRIDIESYLALPCRYEENGVTIECKSALMAALIDARKVTGRDLNTGKIINIEETGCWAGTLAYMSLIDHIGTVFKKSTFEIQNENSFIDALKNFSDLKEEDINALYALRCSFVHNYFLYNIHPRNKPQLTHLFNVTRGQGPVVALPFLSWNGNVLDRNNITTVNLEAFGNLSEDIYKHLQNLLKDGQLTIKVQEEKFKSNYLCYQR